MLEVISLGAGVQSTTMALMAAHGEIEPMPHCAIFADTGAEPPEVYEHLEWLRGGNVLPFPVHVAQGSNLAQDLRRSAAGERGVFGRERGFVAPPFFTLNEDESEGMLGRDCTQEYKIRAIERRSKELLGADLEKPLRTKMPLVRQWIGISADEVHRVKDIGPKWQAKRWPLISRGFPDDHQNLWMNRRDCEAWLARHDYPVPPKSACTFCPYRSNAEWRRLRDHSPEGWRQAVAMDELIRDMPEKADAGLAPGGALFVHRDRVPLAEVNLDGDERQGDLWHAECEGMCGL